MKKLTLILAPLVLSGCQMTKPSLEPSMLDTYAMSKATVYLCTQAGEMNPQLAGNALAALDYGINTYKYDALEYDRAVKGYIDAGANLDLTQCSTTLSMEAQQLVNNMSNHKAEAQRQEDINRQNHRDFMAAMEANKPTQTTCNGYGNTINCTTY